MKALIRSIFCVVLASLALSVSMGACAQAARIQVEVLVFAYNTPEDSAGMAGDDADPRYGGMLLGSGGTDYSALPPESLKLGGAYTALARHARTRSLVHFGWQQDVGSERSVRVRGKGTISGSDAARGLLASEMPELDGDITLKFGRAVEAHVDLLLRQVSASGVQQRFRLNTRRVMSSNGEVHYLDHPAVGVILSITQLEGVAELQ